LIFPTDRFREYTRVAGQSKGSTSSNSKLLIKVDGAPVPRNAAPTLGGDTEYVLRDVLGYLESEISKMAESKAR
jgi:crotonobetainyl-CoA:carnitine CoA-transferase CaiB-like acyl-CoA transferase